MSINLKQYMGYAESEEGENFFEIWEDALITLSAKDILFCTSDFWGYGGSIDFDVLLSSGKVLSYSYAFDSCCDRLDYSRSPEEIEEDITSHSTYFDDITQYDSWVDMLSSGELEDSENSLRKTAKKDRLNQKEN